MQMSKPEVKKRTLQQNRQYTFTYKQNNANISYYERNLEQNRGLEQLLNQ